MNEINKYSLETLNNAIPNNVVHSESEDNFLENLDFIRFLIVARKNIFWILLILFITLSSSYVYVRYTKPIFEASATIKLDIKSDNKILGLKTIESEKDQTILASEVELLKSNLIYEMAIKSLNLSVSYFRRGNITYEELYLTSPFEIIYKDLSPNLIDKKLDIEFPNSNEFIINIHNDKQSNYVKGRIGIPFKFANSEFTINWNKASFKPEFINDKYFVVLNSPESILSMFAGNITIQILNFSANSLNITFKDFTPAKAVDVVNAIVNVYTIESLNKKYQTQEQSLNFLENQLQDVDAKLIAMENNLESFALQNKTFDIKSSFQTSLKKIEALELENIKLRNQLNILTQAIEMLEGQQPIANITNSLTLGSNQGIKEVINQLEKIKAERAKLSFQISDETMVLAQKNKEFNELKEVLQKEIILQKRLIYDELIKNVSTIRSFEEEFLSLPSKDTKLTRIKRYYNLYERYYLMLMDKKAEFGMTKAGLVPEFLILSKPKINNVPIFPKPNNIYLTGLGVGLALSLIWVLIQYFLHNTIDNIGDLQKLVSAPVLGYVPYYNTEKMAVSKLVIDKNPKSPLSESLRAIRTNLDFMGGINKTKKIISVTSTVSGEGKTFIALNLAGVIAFSGSKTVIIDMDMRKPKINLAFETDNDKGMSTILIGKHSIEECIRKSPIETLDFITSGPIPPNPSELILRPEMEAFFEELQKLYQVILIDSPPVGMVTDGTLLMRRADLPIYVVRAEYSKKGYEKNINELHRKFQYHNLSVILNGFKTIRGYGYGYKYGYYGKSYGYYENSEKKKPWWKKIFSLKIFKSN